MFIRMHNNAHINILADASLPGLNEAFPSPFRLSCYDTREQLKALLPEQDVLLCRSTLKVTPELLQHQKLKYIATASSGSDHIDTAFLKTHHIQLIDAKGCNVVSVADYVVACLAFLSQKQKIKNKTAGIIGLGHVGTEVYKRLDALGYTLHQYDPLKASLDPAFQSCTLEALSHCSVICIHAALHDDEPYPSKHLINEELLSQLKPGCIMINASRGEIVDESALLKTAHRCIYCTDVYAHEPDINPEIVAYATIATPHIAGHSLEAKYRAVAMVSKQLHRQFGLTTPTDYAQPNQLEPIKKTNTTWEASILSLYNPLEETLELKQAHELSTAFQTLRKKHHTRHDFPAFYRVS